jgi:glycosyltransferase involved in cell wall biosynthesis
MKISAIIPAYNSSGTIRATIDSVLAQTVQPDEVLVMDDGSTDDTASLVAEYAPRVSLMRQENRGVAAARNVLCSKASGDLIAFLDSDDLWHPHYLEVQSLLFESYPNAVALFTGHVDFYGDGSFRWDGNALDAKTAAEVIRPMEFLRRINWAPGSFATPCCCIPKSVLAAVGPEPFKLQMAEDLYFFNRVAPLGPVVYSPVPLGAVRIRHGSLSSNNLMLAEAETRMCELLGDFYERIPDPGMGQVFRESFAMKRRLYAKLLLGVGESGKARKQLMLSVACCHNPLSVAKSLALLSLAYLPSALQPKWPSPYREGLEEDGASLGRK